MAKIDVTLFGIVLSVKDLGTKLSRVMLFVTSTVQHNHCNTMKMLSVPKQVPIDMKDSDNLAAQVSAGKAIKLHVTGEPGNLHVEITSVSNCPGIILESLVTSLE
ncbi:MAG: hypothetical protein J6Y91_05840 [Alphaproteobacteria bacterium]|nr:hypothetical protein [Alphaproteobacteria bacterium]